MKAIWFAPTEKPNIKSGKIDSNANTLSTRGANWILNFHYYSLRFWLGPRRLCALELAAGTKRNGLVGPRWHLGFSFGLLSTVAAHLVIVSAQEKHAQKELKSETRRQKKNS